MYLHLVNFNGIPIHIKAHMDGLEQQQQQQQTLQPGAYCAHSARHMRSIQMEMQQQRIVSIKLIALHNRVYYLHVLSTRQLLVYILPSAFAPPLVCAPLGGCNLMPCQCEQSASLCIASIYKEK